jgi:hypothetical protein
LVEKSAAVRDGGRGKGGFGGAGGVDGGVGRVGGEEEDDARRSLVPHVLESVKEEDEE